MVAVRWGQAELCRQAHLIKVNGACKVTVRPDTSSVSVSVVLFQIFLNSSALSVSRSGFADAIDPPGVGEQGPNAGEASQQGT